MEREPRSEREPESSAGPLTDARPGLCLMRAQGAKEIALEQQKTVRVKCQQCAVRLSALCSSVSQEAANDLGRAVHRRRVPAGQIVYDGQMKGKSFAIIVSGVVKLINAKPDGRYQIVGLQFASDFLGRPFSTSSNLIAEAATDLDLCCFSGKVFEGLMSKHSDVETAILKRLLDDLDTAREWMFMIGRKTAQERVASILVIAAERLLGQTGKLKDKNATVEFELPLSRTEIAECLALRLETVSRQFANLRSKGVISTIGRRRIALKNYDELRLCAEASDQ